MSSVTSVISIKSRDLELEPGSVATPRRALADRFLLALAFILLGYALCGRGFAHLGVSPIYMGEVVLAIGAAAYLMMRGPAAIFHLPQTIVLLVWMAWCLYRTLQCLPQFGFDALRDGVVWGYAAFAIIVATAIVENPERLRRLIHYYGRFVVIFLCLIPIVFVLYRAMGIDLPKLPNMPGALVQLKEADAMVHLSGILAFWTGGFFGKINWKWLLLLILCIGMMGVIDRSGVVAFGAVTFICLALAPKSTVTWRIFAVGALGLFALWASDFRYDVPRGKGRQISFDQFVTNTVSIAGSSNNDGLDSTKEWRVNWWRDIRDYTVNGRYFWDGKGFGINLADDDGYQVLADNSLRSPHNVHLMILARAGVPGFLLWVASQVVFGISIAIAHFRARWSGDSRWAQLFLFLGAYWLALLINGSFDVYIEGPMGGIWFWTVFGVGLAAMALYRKRPDLLDDLPGDAPVESPAGSTEVKTA